MYKDVVKMSALILRSCVIILLFNSQVLLGEPDAQVWDVDRLIRARNPGAVFSTTERSTTTWQTLRSITYNPKLEEGSVGSASIEEASLVRRIRPTQASLDSGQTNTRLSMLTLLTGLMLAAAVRWT
eukprot:TRINITY_DN15102_c0_g1_i1.p2 TRINITY_DN15102_c0_g1~~TRINITY_DN15102_c0_g1_i1.p2  ORF type:complete len:127 (-),score=8.73 TRINITY_DN15102_c0_g1_i1:280-660(-)